MLDSEQQGLAMRVGKEDASATALVSMQFIVWSRVTRQEGGYLCHGDDLLPAIVTRSSRTFP